MKELKCTNKLLLEYLKKHGDFHRDMPNFLSYIKQHNISNESINEVRLTSPEMFI